VPTSRSWRRPRPDRVVRGCGLLGLPLPSVAGPWHSLTTSAKKSRRMSQIARNGLVGILGPVARGSPNLPMNRLDSEKSQTLQSAERERRAWAGMVRVRRAPGRSGACQAGRAVTCVRCGYIEGVPRRSTEQEYGVVLTVYITSAPEGDEKALPLPPGEYELIPVMESEKTGTPRRSKGAYRAVVTATDDREESPPNL
jgi:hypothetical protein